MSIASHVLILLVTFIAHNEGSRILAVFPTPSISHQVVFRPLILELVNRGHEVILLTTDPIFKKAQRPANLTEIDVHGVSYQTYKDTIKHSEIMTGKKNDLQEQIESIFSLMLKVFEKQLLTDEMQSILKNKSKKFDLLILEAYFDPLLGLTHVYKDTPVIQISSLAPNTDNMKMFGAPMHPLLHQTSIQQRIFNLSLWDKLIELHNHFRMEGTIEVQWSHSNELLKKIFGRDVPDISELKHNVDMLFLNVHPVWDMNRPVPPNVIYLGGLHQKPQKELPKDLKKYLDSSKNGVIYVSFGTHVELAMLPSEKLKALTDAFSKLPYDILWKWNQDVLPGQSKNIRISKWLPQSDLLRHPKIKLFITQGGLQSTDEAITAGVPLIGIPMFVDQWFNVEQYVHHKIGLQVYMDTITAEKVENAVQTIVKDNSYRTNIVRLRTLMRDQPQTPLDRAVWWTEYVIRHRGAKHLRSPASNISWAVYYELKLVSLLLICLFTVVFAVSCIGYSLYNLLIKHHVSIKVKSS